MMMTTMATMMMTTTMKMMIRTTMMITSPPDTSSLPWRYNYNCELELELIQPHNCAHVCALRIIARHEGWLNSNSN